MSCDKNKSHVGELIFFLEEAWNSNHPDKKSMIDLIEEQLLDYGKEYLILGKRHTIAMFDCKVAELRKSTVIEGTEAIQEAITEYRIVSANAAHEIANLKGYLQLDELDYEILEDLNFLINEYSIQAKGRVGRSLSVTHGDNGDSRYSIERFISLTPLGDNEIVLYPYILSDLQEISKRASELTKVVQL